MRTKLKVNDHKLWWGLERKQKHARGRLQGQRDGVATATRGTAEASLKTGQLCWDFRMRGDRPRPAWARTCQAEGAGELGLWQENTVGAPEGGLPAAPQMGLAASASLAHGSLEPGGDVSPPRSSCPGPLPSHRCQPRSNSSRWRRSSGKSDEGQWGFRPPAAWVSAAFVPEG